MSTWLSITCWAGTMVNMKTMMSLSRGCSHQVLSPHTHSYLPHFHSTHVRTYIHTYIHTHMYVYIAPTACEFLHQRGVCVLCVHGMTSLLQTTVKYIAVTYNSFWLCVHTYMLCGCCVENGLWCYFMACVCTPLCVSSCYVRIYFQQLFVGLIMLQYP